MGKLIICIGVVMFLCAGASAVSTVYSTGFEQGEVPPAYVLGPVNGQDSWSSNGSTISRLSGRGGPSSAADCHTTTGSGGLRQRGLPRSWFPGCTRASR